MDKGSIRGDGKNNARHNSSKRRKTDKTKYTGDV